MLRTCRIACTVNEPEYSHNVKLTAKPADSVCSSPCLARVDVVQLMYAAAGLAQRSLEFGLLLREKKSAFKLQLPLLQVRWDAS